MQQSISDILAKAAQDTPLSREDFEQEIYRGIIRARAYYDEALQDVAHSTSMISVEPTSIAASFYVQYLRDKTSEFCSDEVNAPVLQKAIQMDPDALDQACALIIENFMPEMIMTRDTVFAVASTPAGKGEHSIPSAKSRQMKNYMDLRMDEYINIYNRKLAGPVFGLADTIEERLEMDDQMIRILRDALLYGTDNNKPGSTAPDIS